MSKAIVKYCEGTFYRSKTIYLVESIAEALSFLNRVLKKEIEPFQIYSVRMYKDRLEHRRISISGKLVEEPK